MRYITAFSLFLLTACGTAAEVQAENTPAAAEATAAAVDEAPTKVVAGHGCKRTAEEKAAHAATHGEDCDGKNCDKGCDKGAHGEAHASAHGADGATHAATEGHDCDGNCEGGCDKSAHAAAAQGDATHAAAHGAAAHADCACKGKAETRWCDSCNRGFIDGEPTNDQDAVKAALDKGV